MVDRTRSPWRLVPALVLVAAALSGCDTPDRGPARRVTVRAHLSHDPPSLSLLGKSDNNTERVAAQITDSLLQYDPSMQIVPRVAESWSFSEDRLTMTIRLRPGVRWHDGTPVTAEDVVFTVEQARDPAVESRTWQPLFRDLVSIEALDSATVEARFSLASPDVLEAWRVPLLPRHLAESGAELITGEFAQAPVGCGPFRFVRYEPGQEIVLDANEDYWDGPPTIDRLVLRIYGDTRTALQALLAGELDVMNATPTIWKQVQDSPDAGRVADFVYYRTAVWGLRWNMDGSNPFFVDPEVRRAMLMAVDRWSFAETVIHGMARVAATSYHPDLPWTDPDVRPVPFDPQEAGRVLDEAGWRRPAPGATRERDGRPFRFTLMIIASSQQVTDQMAAWLQQSWAEVGLEAEIEKLEWSHYRERRGAHQFEAAMGGFVTTPSPDLLELFHSDAIEDGVNYGSFADAEVDRLAEQGRTTFDVAERREIYFRLQRRLHTLQPIGVLFHFATPVLHSPRLTGIVPAPIDYFKTTEGPRVWRWAEASGGG